MTASDWVALVTAVLWPVTVLVLVVILRQPIAALLNSIGGRITSVSVASVSIELAVEVAPPWRGREGEDVRGLVPAKHVDDSYFDTLRQSLFSLPRKADYFVVDLKSVGRQEWLTSRLYLFSWVLNRMKDVRAVVFLATLGDVGRSFVGVADVEQLMLRLEESEPWFRRARWVAETSVMIKPPPADRNHLRRWQQPANAPDPQPDPALRVCGCCGESLKPQVGPPPLPPDAPLDVEGWWRAARTDEVPWRADPLDVARAFTESIQWSQHTGVADPGAGWLKLPSPNTPSTKPIWEHAKWVTLPDISDEALRDVIQFDARVIDDRSWSKAAREQAVAHTQGNFVALLSPTDRFERLVDRRSLLESLGAAAAER